MDTIYINAQTITGGSRTASVWAKRGGVAFDLEQHDPYKNVCSDLKAEDARKIGEALIEAADAWEAENPPKPEIPGGFQVGDRVMVAFIHPQEARLGTVTGVIPPVLRDPYVAVKLDGDEQPGGWYPESLTRVSDLAVSR